MSISMKKSFFILLLCLLIVADVRGKWRRIVICVEDGIVEICYDDEDVHTRINTGGHPVFSTIAECLRYLRDKKPKSRRRLCSS